MSRTGNKSLAMRKLEKSLTAVIDKGYTRKPYDIYPLINFNEDTTEIFSGDGLTHIDFVTRERIELLCELENLKTYVKVGRDDLIKESLDKIMDEIADVSNCLDYMYETALKEYMEVE